MKKFITKWWLVNKLSVPPCCDWMVTHSSPPPTVHYPPPPHTVHSWELFYCVPTAGSWWAGQPIQRSEWIFLNSLQLQIFSSTWTVSNSEFQMTRSDQKLPFPLLVSETPGLSDCWTKPEVFKIGCFARYWARSFSYIYSIVLYSIQYSIQIMYT